MRVKKESEKAGLKTKIMASSPINSWQIEGEKVEAVIDFLLGSKITTDGDCSNEIRRWSVLKSKDITLVTKICIVKAMVFAVVMYECESWTIKKAECWRIDTWIVVLEKILGSPFDSKEIKPVNLKGTQPWTGRTNDDAPILWLPDVKSWLVGKDPDAGKDWRREEKRAAEDEMAGWYHQLNEHEFEQAPGDNEG